MIQVRLVFTEGASLKSNSEFFELLQDYIIRKKVGNELTSYLPF